MFSCNIVMSHQPDNFNPHRDVTQSESGDWEVAAAAGIVIYLAKKGRVERERDKTHIFSGERTTGRANGRRKLEVGRCAGGEAARFAELDVIRRDRMGMPAAPLNSEGMQCTSLREDRLEKKSLYVVS